jgi:DNA-binding transcriptional ArsR family regulator
MFTKNIEAFKAMGSEPRQQILQAINEGTSNPGKISRKLTMPRSTVEKHLRILLQANLITKLPILNEKQRISVSYTINPLTYQLRDTVDK